MFFTCFCLVIRNIRLPSCRSLEFRTSEIASASFSGTIEKTLVQLLPGLPDLFCRPCTALRMTIWSSVRGKTTVTVVSYHYLSTLKPMFISQVYHLMKVVGSGCGSTFASRWSFARLWWHISCSQRITHLYISKKSKACSWLHTATQVELVSYWSSQCRNIPPPALATYLCPFQAAVQPDHSPCALLPPADVAWVLFWDPAPSA